MKLCNKFNKWTKFKVEQKEEEEEEEEEEKRLII